MVVVVADHGGYRGQHGWTPPFIAEVFVPLLIRGNLMGREGKGREGKGREGKGREGKGRE